METSAPAPASEPSPRRGPRRLPFLFAVLALPIVIRAGASVLFPEMARNFLEWLTLLGALLGILLALVWVLLLSGLRWTRRLGILALAAVAVMGGKRLVRVDGAVNGTGLPRVVWAWAPTKDQLLAAAPAPARAAAAPAAAGPAVADFAEFLGPGRHNELTGVRLDHDWAAHPPRQVWRQPIGLGWSGFSVVRGVAVTQEQRGADELVSAYDVRTGALVWAHTNHVRFTEWQGGDGPRSTPTIASERVYAYGATGVLDCLELATGRLLWSHDVLKESEGRNLTWGKSSAPLVTEDLVVVTGGNGGPALVAYRPGGGEPAWRAGSDEPGYASPALEKVAGVRQILSMNHHTVSGHDPATGRQLWSFDWPGPKVGWPTASQPVVVGEDGVFLSAGYSSGCILIKVSQTGSAWSAAEVWRGKTMKTQFNNVSVRGGCIYGLDDGLMACVDVATGRRVWKDGRYGGGQSLLVDDVLLVQSENGPVAMVEASPAAFRELGRIEGALGSKTWNNPTLASPYLLVRNDQEAACYELPLLAAAPLR